MRSIAFGLAGALSALVLGNAQAHWSDLAVTEVLIEGSRVQMTLTYPTGLTAFADNDGSGQLSANEVAQNLEALQRTFNDQIKLGQGPNFLPWQLQAVTEGQMLQMAGIAPNTHSTVQLVGQSSRPIEQFSLEYRFFVPGVTTASSLATINFNGQVQSHVFTPQSPSVVLNSHGAPTDFGSFFLLGLEHILGGLDHLLFLLALLMLGGGLRYLLTVVTAFTVAHSITLSLTALGLISLPGVIVESGIALSIAYVAAENLLKPQGNTVRSRWVITFLFGLLHGMGFADILIELGLPQEGLLAALLGFNLGVEAGQLLVVLPAFAFLLGLRHLSWEGGLRRAVSVFAMGAGLFWFVQRAFLG